MLCKNGNKNLLKSPKHWFEPKLDGVRIFLYKEGDNYRIINRKNKKINHLYPEFEKVVREIRCDECILDCEIITYDSEGIPDFKMLQAREKLKKKNVIELKSKENPATIIVFDILSKNNKKVMKENYEKRKQILENTINVCERIQLCPWTSKGEKLWNHVKKFSLEGIIAKRKNSYYNPGIRSDKWLKIKNLKTFDAVIIGFNQEKREVKKISVGVYKNNELVYVCDVEKGITKDISEELINKLNVIKKPGVINPPDKKIWWTEPSIICEIKFSDYENKEIKKPVLRRLRYNKKTRECLFEQLS